MSMSSETLERIQAVANERQALWRLAGRGQISAAQRQRIDEITNELPVLWDRHRRELVAENSSRYTGRKQFDAA